MPEEIIIQEGILEKVRQRLGSLEGNAEQAVAEALAILEESQQRQALSQQKPEQFVSANVSVVQYETWSSEERFQYLNNAQKINARWIEQKFQKLNADWLMVIDGQVVAYNSDVQKLLRKHELAALCQKYGKHPYCLF